MGLVVAVSIVFVSPCIIIVSMAGAGVDIVLVSVVVVSVLDFFSSLHPPKITVKKIPMPMRAEKKKLVFCLII